MLITRLRLELTLLTQLQSLQVYREKNNVLKLNQIIVNPKKFQAMVICKTIFNQKNL